MIEAYMNFIEDRITAMATGTEFGVKELFGENWPEIEKPKEFGRQFKAAVKEGRITGVEWITIANSGRYDVYRKQ